MAESQSLHELAVSGCVADGRIACEGLNVVHGPFIGAGCNGHFRAAVLVAQGNFEIEDLLATALEPEMARLNDTGVDRSDGDFVYLFALDPEKIHHRWEDVTAGRAIPGVGAGGLPVKPNGLEPWVADGEDAPLLGYLAFKKVRLCGLRGQRGIGLVGGRADDGDSATTVVGQDGDHFEAAARRHCEQGGYPAATAYGIQYVLSETGEVMPWDAAKSDRLSIIDCDRTV
jgi:hypothetical protein